MRSPSAKRENARSNAPAAVIHVDLDGAEHVYRHHGWPFPGDRDPVFESAMPRLLDLFESHGIRATLFAIAQDLENPGKRALLERAVRDGHEIASHSLTHPEFDRLGREQKRYELTASRELLESTLGVPVRGFRCPSYQIDRETFGLLGEAGYEWDSSVFPELRSARRLGLPSLRPGPHRPLYDSPTLELPLPGHRPAPFPFNPSYSLLLGRTYFELNLRRHQRIGEPLVLLFHLVDFADPLPASILRGWKSRLFTLSMHDAETKQKRCQAFLERVKQSYELTDTASLLEVWREKEEQSPSFTMGISTTHETGASIFAGNECLAAISEERLDRVKFSSVYPPTRSIDAVIATAGVDPRRITDIVISGLPPRRLFRQVLRGQLRDLFEFHGWIDYFPHMVKVLYRAFSFTRSLGYGRVRRHFERHFQTKPRLHFVAHHLCHAASAYRTAPFDEALVITADGVGDETSVSVSHGKEGELRLLKLIPYPHSFGQFYTACTQLLGFRANRHEGKITGLSAYGRPDSGVVEKVRSTIRRSGPDFALDKRFFSEGIVRRFSWKRLRRGEDMFEALGYRNYKTPLQRLLADETREDVAYAFQTVLEEELVALVRPYAEKTGARNLCLAGGVFANVKANSALFHNLGFEKIYIYPHMGDGGLGPGAVLEFLQARPASFEDVYWGPEYTEDEMERALRAAHASGLRFQRKDEIERVIAERLAEGKVIARFNGRMEFGPRALGNRSILYSPGDRDANRWLNDRLGRTEFMPFAPMVLADKAPELFKGIAGTEHACKFMTLVLDCTDWMAEKCPAVVHVDGTARPQFVHEATNPSAHQILTHFNERTGIPVLVNTSFNMHEEPIVCSPQDATRAYVASRLDYLAMGPFLAWLEGPSEDGESG